jgi:hypothetical protein
MNGLKVIFPPGSLETGAGDKQKAEGDIFSSHGLSYFQVPGEFYRFSNKN